MNRLPAANASSAVRWWSDRWALSSSCVAAIHVRSFRRWAATVFATSVSETVDVTSSDGRDDGPAAPR